LATRCRDRYNYEVIRVSIDDFHNPKSVRYRRGRDSPEGYWLDAFDYQKFRAYVLEPLGAGGSRFYRSRHHDLSTDLVLGHESSSNALPGSVVIVDGVFLHRQELIGAWNFSVFLDVSAEICRERMLIRDGIEMKLDATARYYGAHLLYFADCSPKEKATVLIENSSPQNPIVIKAPSLVDALY
jgi:uridine kinase